MDQNRLLSEDYSSWNFHFSRNLSDREILQLQSLLQILDGRHLCNTLEDKRIWLADSSRIFSCKSAFGSFTESNSFPINHQVKCIWKMTIPVKVKVFIWLQVLGKLNVHNILQRKRPYQSLSPGWCVLCKRNNETIDYLFLHCEFSFSLWSNILQQLGKFWVIPRSSSELVSLGQSFSLSKKGRTLWKFAASATLWGIWLERNKRIFEGFEESVQSTWDRIRMWVAIWLHVCKDFKSIPFSLLIRDWNPFL